MNLNNHLNQTLERNYKIMPQIYYYPEVDIESAPSVIDELTARELGVDITGD